MKVFFFWEPVGGLTLQHRCNPYAGLLALAMEKLDIHLELGEYALERDWLEKNRKDYNVLHLNWLHYFYRSSDLETTVKRYTGFAENLTFARSLGYRIIWTMHNLYPHERPFPGMDHVARLLVCQLAHDVIAHCKYASDLARKTFYRTERLHVIPHGHFIDVFPNDISRQEARKKLNISEEAFVYLFFGNARTYKGIERLIDAFCNAAEADARLVLMMRQSFNPQYGDEVKKIAEKDKRIHVFTSPFFANSEFQTYLKSADVAVLPFSEVLTSGSAIAALSFGKPVVLPKLGCLPELIDDTIGLLYDPKDEGGLERALVEIRKRDLKAAGRLALERAKRLDWDGIAWRIAELYRGK
jgi:glycosyltransferase involved in cell wall biosynthesis